MNTPGDNILDPMTLSFLTSTRVLPHDEGTLWVPSDSRIQCTFTWHQFFDDPENERGPYPILEIRKAIADRDGVSHESVHYNGAAGLFMSVNGRRIFTSKAFRCLTNGLYDGQYYPLTSYEKFHCDSGDLLLFQYHEESWTESRVCSHFDKYSGGSIRVVCCRREPESPPDFYLQSDLCYIDDRITHTLIDPEDPQFLEIDLDLWSSCRDIRSVPELFEPSHGSYGPFPAVFFRTGNSASRQPGVQVIPETWSPSNAKKLLSRQPSPGCPFE